MSIENIKTKQKHTYAITKLINTKNYICYNESIAKIYNPITAIVFAKLVNLYDLFGNEEFYFEQKRLAADTSLSEYQIRESIKELVASEVVLMTKKGIPCKNYYEININALLELLSELEKNPSFKFIAPEPKNKKNVDVKESDNKKSNSSRCSSKKIKDKNFKNCSSSNEKIDIPLKELESKQLEPNTALNSFADAHEFKDADACTPAEPHTPPSKAVCHPLSHAENSPDNEDCLDTTTPETNIPDDIMNSDAPRFFNSSSAHTGTQDIFREQEETMHTASDLNSSEDRQAASEETSPLNPESSGTHSAGGGFPFADDARPERAKRKAAPKKKSRRKTLSDEELDEHFAALDSGTVMRMHEITETLYKKARIADPLYVRSGNFLRNQTKKLTDFLASSGRTADEAESVFNFGFTDSFWCNVVVSVDIFIRNYTKILQKMRERRPAQQAAVKKESAFESAGIGRGDYREEW